MSLDYINLGATSILLAIIGGGIKLLISNLKDLYATLNKTVSKEEFKAYTEALTSIRISQVSQEKQIESQSSILEDIKQEFKDFKSSQFEARLRVQEAAIRDLKARVTSLQ